MLTRSQFRDAQARAAAMIDAAGIHITAKEREEIAVADFGLSQLEHEGGQILTYFATQRISVKVIALFPNQTLPEHWHPPVGDDPGKEETVRVVSGLARFYVPGNDTLTKGFIPRDKGACYTCRHENVLHPGDQLTLPPNTKHWFQAGPEGSVLYSFSTCVRDGLDGFTDPDIVRETKVVDEDYPKDSQ